jgi:hypothetical protein
MKIKTSKLQEEALDRMVAKCEVGDAINEIDDPHFYSTDWAQGGPIIERERIGFKYTGTAMEFVAWVNGELSTVNDQHGPTPLIAAMRCYVASKLGDEVEVPEELVKGEIMLIGLIVAVALAALFLVLRL